MTVENSGRMATQKEDRPRRAWRRWSVGPIAFAVASMGLAACGGGSKGPEVSGAGSTSSTATPSGDSSGVGSTFDKALAYVKCMRTHGIPDMPDPDNTGNVNIKGLNPAPGSDLSPANARFAAANRTCQHLLPNGGRVPQAERQHNQTEALQWAHCMRAHGIRSFPDPDSSGVISVHSFSSAGLSPVSPQFQAASTACRKYRPGNIALGPAAP